MGEYDLHDNVAVDLVRYVRSNTIRNEQQFIMLVLAYNSGLFADTNDYVSSVCIGTSSSGKSHLKKKNDALFEHINVMDASTGTEKSLIHDNEWDEADVISMGELQQPPEEMIEFLKRAHGGDEEVVIRQTRGNPQSGFETEKITKKSKSYHFTFAQFDADFEFWNRLLKLPVHESESKNRAVGRMEAGHDNISIGDDGIQYGYDFEEGKKALQQHFADVKAHAPKRAKLPNGQGDYEWDVWSVVEPIFNHSRSESNRVYQMIFNLIRSSAMLNYKNRDRTTVTEDGEEHEAVVVEAQDVANITRCLEALQSTTHEIDQKKRAIVEAIRAKSGPDDAIEGLAPIREFLKESDAPEVKQGELEAILGDLADNFLVEINEEAGEGGRDVYRAYKWDKLGVPRIDEYADLFKDCVDPIGVSPDSGGPPEELPFMETWADQREDLETTAQDLLKTAQIDSGGNTRSSGDVDSDDSGPAPATDDGDAGLSAYGGGVEEEEDEDPVELNPWTAVVLDRVAPVLDNSRIPDMEEVPVEAFLGLTSISDPDLTNLSVEDTMLDPDHKVWIQRSKPDEWVETSTQARREIQGSISELIDEGVIRFKEVHESRDGSPVDATLSVHPPAE